MTPPDPTQPDPAWSDAVRSALSRYDEALLRQVAGRLLKPRNFWPAEELIERSLATLHNAPVIDRRLKDLPPAARKLMAAIGHSRQPRWPVGPLVSLLAALGHAEGVAPLLALMDEGLLYPELPSALPLRQFDTWFAQGTAGLHVFALPSVAHRARGEDLGLPTLAAEGAPAFGVPVQEADGLDWPLRLAVLWQQVAGAPLRRTQQQDFFKRDLQRLRADPLLNAPAAEQLADLPDAGPLVVLLALREGLIADRDGELCTLDFSVGWREGLLPVLASLWACLPRLEEWDPVRGWRGPPDGSENPYPSAYLLAGLLLARLPADAWARPAALEQWLHAHHPHWADGRSSDTDRGGATAFLLGLAFPLRLVQAARDPEGGWLVRLTALGRWLLAGGPVPDYQHAYRQTLLVQPNYEVLVYRQGLDPRLIAELSHFAVWKTLGAACLLELNAAQVYRGLERGQTLEGILHTLQQHGMRPLPDAVRDALKTWANKRERIVVYPKATLVEFASAADLNEAIARGLLSVKLTDRIGLVGDESLMQYRHFRLTGTRDYAAPPERCVEVDEDGVTLGVDSARSDLLLEIELARLAEPVGDEGDRLRRRYRLTPTSLRHAQRNGWSLTQIDEWFEQRSGQRLSPAGRLLATADQQPPLRLARWLVLQVESAEVADGLTQWAETRGLIAHRAGPTALLVTDENLPPLRERLEALGLRVTAADDPGTG